MADGLWQIAYRKRRVKEKLKVNKADGLWLIADGKQGMECNKTSNLASKLPTPH